MPTTAPDEIAIERAESIYVIMPLTDEGDPFPFSRVVQKLAPSGTDAGHVLAGYLSSPSADRFSRYAVLTPTLAVVTFTVSGDTIRRDVSPGDTFGTVLFMTGGREFVIAEQIDRVADELHTLRETDQRYATFVLADDGTQLVVDIDGVDAFAPLIKPVEASA